MVPKTTMKRHRILTLPTKTMNNNKALSKSSLRKDNRRNPMTFDWKMIFEFLTFMLRSKHAIYVDRIYLCISEILFLHDDIINSIY